MPVFLPLKRPTIDVTQVLKCMDKEAQNNSYNYYVRTSKPPATSTRTAKLVR